MKIGIDIDDVVVETGQNTIEYARKYEHLFCENKEISNNLKDLMRGNFINEPTKKFVRAYAAESWQSVKLKPNAVEVLNELKSKHHQLIFITGRGSHMTPEAEKITYDYFKKHQVPYDKIIFNIYDKRQTLIDEKIDIFIDDSVDTCNAITENTNIKVYLFNSEINQDLPCNAQRIHNWTELEKLIA